ncbi:MAG: hypothetical protein LBG97_09715 [Coriobacteriales bacterium]|jgi:3-hydroxyacyl-[acyl-carrier-protein] dehydratase|nr:hypothetical protein [Coriobacteriales bacterium]
MTNQEIKQRLPHRWPFLFVDRVTKLTEKIIEGYKNVSASEIVFLGHFPEVSIFPGVLIVESLAQLSGLLLLNRGAKETEGFVHENSGLENSTPDNSALGNSTPDNSAPGNENKIGFLTSIRSFKFIKTVQPGDQMFLKSIYKGNNADCYIFDVSAYVDKFEVAVGEIQLFLQKKEDVV